MTWVLSQALALYSIFRRKPAPDLIRGVQRFAAENASNAGNLEHDPMPKERIMLEGSSCGKPDARAKRNGLMCAMHEPAARVR